MYLDHGGMLIESSRIQTPAADADAPARESGGIGAVVCLVYFIHEIRPDHACRPNDLASRQDRRFGSCRASARKIIERCSLTRHSAGITVQVHMGKRALPLSSV